MKINKIWKTILNSLAGKPKAVVTEVISPTEEEAEAKAEHLRVRKIVEKIKRDFQKMGGVPVEKCLDLLIPTRKDKKVTSRTVTFDTTEDMVAYLKDKGFVPYDIEYVEEARCGKYPFIRVKRDEVENYFEFPDVTFNGPEFYTPYKWEPRPIYTPMPLYIPPYTPLGISYVNSKTVEEIESADGQISSLEPTLQNKNYWTKNELGIYSPNAEEDIRDAAIAEEKKNVKEKWEKHFLKTSNRSAAKTSDVDTSRSQYTPPYI